MCFIDHDGWQHIETRTVKARTPHRCNECCRADSIPPDAPYQRTVGKIDGYLDVIRICEPCQRLRRAIYDHEIAEGCAPHESHCPVGYASEYLLEIGYDFDEASGKLIPKPCGDCGSRECVAFACDTGEAASG